MEMFSKRTLLLMTLVTALSIAYLYYLSQRVQAPAKGMQMKIFTSCGDSSKYGPNADSDYQVNISILNLSMGHLDTESSYETLYSQWSEQKSDFSILTTYHLPNQFQLPMESEILNDKPLENITSLVSPDKSLIKILEDPDVIHSEEKRMMVLVDLRDELGRKVSNGGHQVRVWLTDKERGLSATLHVTDLHNGLYIALFPLLWNGNTTVNAALVKPREFVQMTLRQYQRLKVIRPLTASFTCGNISQATLCMPFPMVQGYQKVCNLTAANSGLPWYCGKPTHPNLTCSDWAFSKSLYECSRIYPVTNAEKEVLKKFPLSSYIFPLKGSVKIMKEDGILAADNNISCYKRESRATWTDQSPRGYWKKEVWHHLMCSVPSKTESFLAQCFSNTTFLMLGDSNAQATYNSILEISKCKPRETTFIAHKSLFCSNDRMGLHIAWHPHAYPFHSWEKGWAIRSLKHPPSYYMDQIPAVGKFVVLVHLYAHFTWDVTHAYIPHVRDVVRATRDLVQRNPSAKVVIRGPHVYKNPTGDYIAMRLFPILKEEFKSLQDSVVFLDGWDMTVAVENTDIHPPLYVVDAMTMVLLGHVCP